MIKNDRQYRITKSWAAKFQKTLDDTRSTKSDLPPLLAKAERDGLKGQLHTLLEEIKEYEQLQSGQIKVVDRQPVLFLSDTLIQARIANKLTQEELAKRLDLHPQQIQQYEATGYSGANLERVASIADALGVTVTVHFLPDDSGGNRRPAFLMRKKAIAAGKGRTASERSKLYAAKPRSKRRPKGESPIVLK